MTTHGITVIRTPLARWKMLLLWRWLLVRPGYGLSQQVYTHEGIHLCQMREMTAAGFYLWYAVEYAVKLVAAMSWERAYRSVSFEQEAYGNEGDVTWCDARPRRYWKQYVFRLR